METPKTAPILLTCLLGAACFAPAVAPAVAMLAGMALSAAAGERIWKGPAGADRLLLQASVVLLGLGMDVRAVLRAGVDGMGLSAVLLALTFLGGLGLARLLRLDRQASLLVSAGTAICGGSAIAAVAASTRARREATGLAMATVFLLNALALVLFPWIGHRIGLSPHDFGTWAGLAVHDVSSVVGAAASFDPQALPVAIAVKLGRTLWILPVSLVAAWLTRKVGRPEEGKATVPFFLLGFLATALLTSVLPGLQGLVPAARTVSHGGFNLALFLIGLRFESSAIRRGGVGLLLQGTVQWIVAATVSLAWILLA